MDEEGHEHRQVTNQLVGEKVIKYNSQYKDDEGTHQRTPGRLCPVPGKQEQIKDAPDSAPGNHHQTSNDKDRKEGVQNIQARLMKTLQELFTKRGDILTRIIKIHYIFNILIYFILTGILNMVSTSK